jgi:hypothetical protein
LNKLPNIKAIHPIATLRVIFSFGGNKKQKTVPAERSGAALEFSAPVIGAVQGKR